MIQRSTTFFSEGFRLDGDLFLPDGAADAPVPAVVVCSGYQGLKVIHPVRFARALVPRGYAVLGFDYRGFGWSDGDRGRLIPQEQVEDVRAAVTHLSAQPEIDAARIGLIGWALGGGVVISAAADDERVRAVAALNAIGDGRRSTRSMHDDASWGQLLERMVSDRTRRVQQGRSELVHPFDVIRLDTVTRAYVDAELYQAAGFGAPVTLEAAERLLQFSPERDVHRISPRPLLLIHGSDNRLHSADESRRLHDLAREPKELVLLEGEGHTEWMFDDHPTFERVADSLAGFLDKGLASPCVV